jgi:hypothetical protein
MTPHATERKHRKIARMLVHMIRQPPSRTDRLAVPWPHGQRLTCRHQRFEQRPGKRRQPGCFSLLNW